MKYNESFLSTEKVYFMCPDLREFPSQHYSGEKCNVNESEIIKFFWWK